MTHDHAQSVAAWVNLHDDCTGLSSPRATIHRSDAGWLVRIRSAEIFAGEWREMLDDVRSLAEARALLGY